MVPGVVGMVKPDVIPEECSANSMMTKAVV